MKYEMKKGPTVQVSSSTKSTHKSPLRIIDPNSQKDRHGTGKNNLMKNTGLQKKRECIGKRALTRGVVMLVI